MSSVNRRLSVCQEKSAPTTVLFTGSSPMFTFRVSGRSRMFNRVVPMLKLSLAT